jgi:hypothetical protein
VTVTERPHSARSSCPRGGQRHLLDLGRTPRRGGKCRDGAHLAGVPSAGRGRPARTPFGFLVWALAVVVPASRCGVCCLSLVGVRICWRLGGMRNISVEALFPEGRERFELGSAGRSRVLGVDAVGGPPHCNVANEGGYLGGVPVQPRPAWRHLGTRDLEPGRRGRQPVGIALSAHSGKFHGMLSCFLDTVT